MSTQGPKDPPEEVLVSRAVAAQIDTLKRHVIVLEQEVRKLRDGFTVLVQRQQQTPTGQPDWRGCREPDQAVAILSTARAWLEDVGPDVKLDLPACWPWHTQAVVLIVAAAAHYRAAMSGSSATAVTEFYTRHINGLRVALTSAIDSDCAGPNHMVGQALYRYDLGRLDELAVWWAASREDRPPGLHPLVSAVR